MAMKRKGGGGRIAKDRLPAKGSEDYISLQQQKKELKGQAVSGAVQGPGGKAVDNPKTTLRGKGAGASAAMRKRLDKVKL